ncbi:MAG: metallophosphoesterase [Chloroflexaceae bacterium]|nr:metallophosphoesterase [Chloroflexaceae bacterium]
MGWRRFFGLILLGIALSIGFACSKPTPPSEQPSQSPTAVQAPAEEKVNPAKIELPPETAAIVAAAGPKGLFNPPRGDVRLLVVSDLNGIYGSTDYDPEVDKAMKLIPFWEPDMVVCSGDMVAGQSPTLSQEQIRAMWAGFDEHIAAPLRQAKLPWGFTIGNHDASSALGVGDKFLFKQERDLAAEYWDDPKHDPGLQFGDRYEFPFYYSFIFKDIFFLVWDGSSNHIPAEKLAWVEKTLASPQAQQAKMRILLGHLPLYAVAVGRNEPGEVMENADELRAMLERYNVHTYISGHHHSYYPAHRGDLQLLHMGILGSGPRPLIDSNLPPWKALTVLDINFDSPELTTYTTYDMQAMQLIRYEQLPRFLTGHNGIVLRRDVEWEDLAPEEQSTCIQRLGTKKCEN